ncbi:MAG: hypothetical protein ABEJ66_00460, partial [Candidatus Nanohaloarchaea archaeon]
RMFDFGNDDKEKLRENMEQIKDLVNEGRSASGDELGEGFEEPEGGPDQDSREMGQLFDTPDQQEEQETNSFNRQQEFDQQQNTQQDTRGFDDRGQDQQEGDIQSFSGDREEELEQELDEFEEKFGGGQQENRQAQQTSQSTPPQQGQQQDQSAQSFEDSQEQQAGQEQQEKHDTPPGNQQRSGTTKGDVKDSRDLSTEVPNPPETRELEVPDIDRGPLFLRQKKFLRAKQMIEDMLYLSDEMEKTVNDLEAGLQEDQEIERDVVEILREFEDNRTEVEDIISPREE